MYGIYCRSLYVYPVTRKRIGPIRAGRALQPQNSKLDHGGQCRALLVSTSAAKERTVYFVIKSFAKDSEKCRREVVSFRRTTSVCHFAPLFYLALYPLSYTKIHSEHQSLQSKFTLHTHVHAHTHGDYSRSLRSQTKRKEPTQISEYILRESVRSRTVRGDRRHYGNRGGLEYCSSSLAVILS
jgi:hypothetical protein